MGEGGAILFQDDRYLEPAEILREKGTNRSQYFRGQIDKYTWVDAGSSYLPSELNAAYLWAQLEQADMVNDNRLKSWNLYKELLTPIAEKEYITLPYIPEECTHNAHMFYIKTKNLEERSALISYLKENGVLAVIFHCMELRQDRSMVNLSGKINIQPERVKDWCVCQCIIISVKKILHMLQS